MAEDLKSKIKKKGLRYLIEGLSSWYCAIIIIIIIVIIVLFILLLAATGYFKKDNNDCTNTGGGGIIVIDPGHSPSTGDPTVDPSTNIWIGDNSGADDEVEANFAVSKYIEEDLKAQGYQVVLTKNSAQESVTLKKRAEIGSTGTAMVSIHFDPGMTKGGILYPPQNGGKQRDGGPIQKVDDVVAQGGKTLANCVSQKIGISPQPDTPGSSANGNITPAGYQPCLVASAFVKVQKILIECPPAKISKQHGATNQTQKELAKQISDGIAACVPKGSETTAGCSGDAIIAEARKHVGKPYVSPGTPPSSFDCSGLVQYCVKQVCGKDIPHNNCIQLRCTTYVTPITKEQLQPGDFMGHDHGGCPNDTCDDGRGHIVIFVGKESDGRYRFIGAEGTAWGVVESTCSPDRFNLFSRLNGATPGGDDCNQSSSANLTFPIDGKPICEFTQGTTSCSARGGSFSSNDYPYFGASRDNGNRKHGGVDLCPASGEGTSVLAIKEGTVTKLIPSFLVRNSTGENTWAIIINHGDFTGFYGEVKANPPVKEGDKVTAGQKIGTVSGTAQLHFEKYSPGVSDTAWLQWTPPTDQPPSGLLESYKLADGIYP